MILTTLAALGELASTFPVPGAFAEYSGRFLDPAWGFTIGYNYLMQWLATLPLEFTAAAIVIRFWDEDGSVPRGVWIAIFFLAVSAIHIIGLRGYAEVEFSATTMKMITIIGFIICAIVIDCGGTPSGQYLGARGWHDGPAFLNKFKGFCSVLTTAAFAFTGTELVGLAAAETPAPHKHIPRACKLVIWRVIVFYFLSLFMITLIILPSDPRLHGTSNYDPNTSPFVLVIEIGAIKVLPHIVNAVIMLSAVSVSNSSVFAGSRTLHALAVQGHAPKFLRYVDRTGRPLHAVIVSLLFGLLGFLIYSSDDNGGEVFSWLLGISGLSVIFTWGSICAAHIRFRAAWAKQGYSVSQLQWRSPFGVYGSWGGLVFNILLVCAQFYLSVFPINEAEKTGGDRVYSFFLGFISAILILVFYIACKVIKRTKIVSLEDIDLLKGRSTLRCMEQQEMEEADTAEMPLWKKILNIFF
ncbi:hypothetical protein MVES1_002933 [Malassezia vespertilionis]|uniref:Amino acid permease/ SLC12A domain-containing protein n=1 Tax=Malassezia vespertilionis TaxID=2020962 RepID=A0A2N1J9X5_9BASI|nr:uncharacterized protein MVES1_002933 [Malassezia vespertilionis]PKI83344.1 hypothetical protein MVES_002782 [Malassezia vespertilionis]WFD07566.1 hypothetical protein MVES1_002933 [Malassezia vespertilionis]